MFRLLSLIFLFHLPHISTAWDVSITVTNGVHLAKEGNGSLVAVHKIDLIGPYHETTRPLVHDPKRDILYISGIIQSNATVIYRVNLSTGYQEKLVITDTNVPAKMEGKILGIEHDYIKNTLFWSNGQGGKILKVELNDSSMQQVVLHDSDISKLITSGLALDQCSQILFWTSYIVRDGVGYIESSNLDGSNRIKLHQNNLHNPTDLTIDQAARKLYWCDMKAGSLYTIERSNLDGSSREELIAGSGVQPTSIALTAKFIYWINIESEKFERMEKDTKAKQQETIFNYEADRPRSIGSHKSIQKCASDDTVVEIKPYPPGSSSSAQGKTSSEQDAERNMYEVEVDPSAGVCLNGGRPVASDSNILNTDDLHAKLNQNVKCKCSQNFYGQFCEKCDHCVNGKCRIGSNSSIQCNCDNGYNGSRCEHDVCFNYCLNGGSCSVENQSEPTCNCRTAEGNFQGSRCEIDCNLFCQNNPSSGIYDAGKPVCSCGGKNGLYVANMENATVSQLSDEKDSSTEMQLRFTLMAVGGLCVIFLIVIVCLITSVIRLRRRPRIKKRIIVSKNVTPTPLTCRPSPVGEQCEITIENCCNMNICETPCYEPQLRTSDKSVSKTEEKKNLLGNMEEGESGTPSQDTLY
ncbi:hypothetical protein R5R35_005788 [Gryllus longicercus]|uniref:Protein cueball n=1 Tax=Gryllus longicercus TaxID=2509291 RepID=A0AAN9WRF9_9ORTH